MKFEYNNKTYFLKTDIEDTEDVITIDDYQKLINIYSERELNINRKVIDTDKIKYDEDKRLEVFGTDVDDEYVKAGEESPEFILKRYENILLILSNIPIEVIKEMQEQYIGYDGNTVFTTLLSQIKNITKSKAPERKLYFNPNNNRYYSYPDLDTISFEQWCYIETLGRPTTENPFDKSISSLMAILLTPIESLDVFDINGQLIQFDSIEAKTEYFKTTDITKVNTRIKNVTKITNPFDHSRIESKISLVLKLPANFNLGLIDYIKKDIKVIRNVFKGLYSSSGGEQSGVNTQTYFEKYGWFDTIISLANNPSPIFNSPSGVLDAVKQRNLFDVLGYLEIKKAKDEAEYKDWKIKNKA